MKKQTIIVVIVLVIFALIIIGNIISNKPVTNSQVSSENELPDKIQRISLAPEVEKELGDIMKFVMATPGEPTQVTKSKFWSIVQNNGVTTQNINDSRELIVGPAVVYIKIFYQDAIESLKVGQVVESAERKRYEDRLLKASIMTQQQYEKNQKILNGIASGLPVTTPQGDIVFTEDIINNIIQSIDEQYNRVNLLFNK